MATSRHLFRAVLAAALGIVLLAAMSSCGGGGGGNAASPTPPAAGILLGGTAAAGLPLAGSVSVKDGSGRTRTATIGASGNYSVEVGDLTPPLVLRADGVVGSTTYRLHSATATVANGNTLNITPLTDLVVAKVAGQAAGSFYDKGQFAALTAADLDAESAALKARLLPVLQAVGVDAAADLMRTPFKPQQDALDKALDVIRVSVDASAGTARIANLLNGQAIDSDLKVRGNAEPNAPALPASGPLSVADLDAARKALVDFAALFSAALPKASDLQPRLADDFFDNGQGAAAFAAQAAADAGRIGVKPVNVQIDRVAADGAGGAFASLSYTIVDSQGRELDRVSGYQMRSTVGLWKLRGNQRLFEFGGGVFALKRTDDNCLASGYEFDIDDHGSAIVAPVKELRVFGASLPTAGIVYRRAASGSLWQLDAGAANPDWYRLASAGCGGLGAAIPDAAIALVPDNAVYLLRAYADDGSEINLGAAHILRAGSRPLTLAELAAADGAAKSAFPTVSAQPPLAGYTGGDLAVSGTGATAGRVVRATLTLTLADGSKARADSGNAVLGGDNGSYSLTLKLPSAAQPVTGRELRVVARDLNGRTWVTVTSR